MAEHPAEKPGESAKPDQVQPDRRKVLELASTGVMASGLCAGYGAMAYMAGRFLYSSEPRKMAWMYVTEAAKLTVGTVFKYRTPVGQTVTITRLKDAGAEDDFLALSSTCPHLGCQVHWQPQENRFFCPCHNGAFDTTGKAIAGPPADAKQSLPQFPLKIENGLIFIQVPADVLG
ncbi:MAG: ubiquinol-cytochrome c reductase iron-sulfur subunit [Gemmataceae bacterium]